MTSIFAALSECQSHLQTVEHLLLSVKEIAQNENLDVLRCQIDDAWQQCKTLASSIDEMENDLNC